MRWLGSLIAERPDSTDTQGLLVDADLVGTQVLITPGDLDGNGMSELLIVRTDGTLKLFVDVNNDPYQAAWSSTG
ncbi:hypothetical protein ABT144_24995 [Streptomyces sp. NPDC002039]|uniref:hypothetical protein n=1 Tax=Streptomyces sp. NPDC002039 TaxID=3154660 RepID=UPI00333272BF